MMLRLKSCSTADWNTNSNSALSPDTRQEQTKQNNGDSDKNNDETKQTKAKQTKSDDAANQPAVCEWMHQLQSATKVKRNDDDVDLSIYRSVDLSIARRGL
jgi:uncharacterized FlaG/YvyC family protein